MNKEYFYAFCDKYELTEEEKNTVIPVYKKVFEQKGELADELWEMLITEEKEIIGTLHYHKDCYYPSRYIERIKEISQESGEDLFVLHLAATITLSEKTKLLYTKNGIPDSMFDSIARLIVLWGRKNARLCGKFALSDYPWCVYYIGYVIFNIGGLDYQLCGYIYDDYENLKKGDMVLKIHIPEGTPFDRESRKNSYRQAYRFYSSRLGIKKLWFVCDSWLMARDHKEFLAGSNLAGFRDDFTIISEHEADESGNLWRIFGTENFASPDTLPEKTRLQRLYKKKLLHGEPYYSAVGVFCMEEKDIGEN